MLDRIYIDAQAVVFAIIGGSLIAFATTLHLMLFGRRTEVSSIFTSLIGCGHDSWFRWKFGFFCGFITGTYGVFMIFGHNLTAGNIAIDLFDQQELSQHGLSTFGFALAGLMVGFGARLVDGCISGHGICGVPQKSLKSFIAMIIFLITGIVTGTVRSSYPILTSNQDIGKEAIEQYKTIADFLYALMLIYFAYDLNVNSSLLREKLETLSCLFIGLVFGLGLSISGMCQRSISLSFLNLNNRNGWNPSFLITLFTAIAVNLVTFNLLQKQKPMFAESFEFSDNKIDWKVIVGPTIFGIGWGLSGLSPAPALVNGFLLMKMLAYIPFMAAGQLLASWISRGSSSASEVGKEMKID